MISVMVFVYYVGTNLLKLLVFYCVISLKGREGFRCVPKIRECVKKKQHLNFVIKNHLAESISTHFT